MLPSASDLAYFVEVAGSLNLSRAAERLGISQPSLTLAVQRLEGSLGTPVLIRSKKGVTLTQAGKQLLVQARTLLQTWDEVKTKALASVEDVQGRYVIGCHPSVALYSLPRFLPKLMEDHPKLEVRLMHDLSRKIAELVIRMEVDLGIVVNPVRHPDLVVRKLYTDEVTFWMAEGCPNPKVLICDLDLIQSQDLVAKLKKSGRGFDRVITTSSLEIVRSLTLAGAGVGIIPGLVVGADAGTKLKRVPRTPVYSDEICLLYRVENKGVRSIQVMGEMIQSEMQRGPTA